MNFDLIVARGQLPWTPNPHAEDLDVWHEHEIPFAGTFQQAGHVILFTAVGNIDSSMTIGSWAYTELLTQPPATFSDVDEMRDWVESQFVGAKAIYAVSRDLVLFRYSECKQVETLYDGASDFLDEVLDSVTDKRSRDLARFSAHQAEVEVVEKELVDA
ncbi:hypothetical protein [Aeromicrobium stalagmiti]|uniref:hypothetical protein n=1 Tax=Aeromicrobium stalagmiti TaxID=2738988 RepID=UPI00156A543D|nr:hypothetical protein [Aeromicrobium stalagmiti]NRQ51567.1 hypothetical protein [Aeromicrobium stalagmiti]